MVILDMLFHLLVVLVVEAIALYHTFPAGWLDGQVEVIIMLSQLSTKLKLKLSLSTIMMDFDTFEIHLAF